MLQHGGGHHCLDCDLCSARRPSALAFYVAGLPRGVLAKAKFVFSAIFRWSSESSSANLFRAPGIERRHVGFVGCNSIAVRKRLGHVVDWSSCRTVMDGCDHMATWSARVLATNAGAGRCRQIRGKRRTFVYVSGRRDHWCYCLYLHTARPCSAIAIHGLPSDGWLSDATENVCASPYGKIRPPYQ